MRSRSRKSPASTSSTGPWWWFRSCSSAVSSAADWKISLPATPPMWVSDRKTSRVSSSSRFRSTPGMPGGGLAPLSSTPHSDVAVGPRGSSGCPSRLPASGPYGEEGEQDPGGEETGEAKQRGHSSAHAGCSGRPKAEQQSRYTGHADGQGAGGDGGVVAVSGGGQRDLQPGRGPPGTNPPPTIDQLGPLQQPA